MKNSLFYDFTKDCLNLNRTIVSEDNSKIFKYFENLIKDTPNVLNFKSGNSYGTWIIPNSWNVYHGQLINLDTGKCLADYETNKLFIAPYSKSVNKVISKKKLLEHCSFHPILNDEFFYEHRLAYNFKLREKTWRVTLPRNTFNNIKKNHRLKIDLKINSKKSNMKIYHYRSSKESKPTIVLLANYCHPSQLNDSWSGLLTMIKVYNEIFKKIKNYRLDLLLLPETIGSSVFLSKNPNYLKHINLSIFTEMILHSNNLSFLNNFSRNEIFLDIFKKIKSNKNIKIKNLYNGYGNDELVFAYCGIPSCSIQNTNFRYYHSSRDNINLLDFKKIDKVKKMICNFLLNIDKDPKMKFKNDVLFYQSRYNMYADAVKNRSIFNRNRKIYNDIKMNKSLSQIQINCGIDKSNLKKIVNKLKHNNLIY